MSSENNDATPFCQGMMMTMNAMRMLSTSNSHSEMHNQGGMIMYMEGKTIGWFVCVSVNLAILIAHLLRYVHMDESQAFVGLYREINPVSTCTFPAGHSIVAGSL